MGADWSSSAVIGVKVSEAACYHTVRVKAFDHGHPPEWTHDPQSGKVLWREVRVCSLGEGYELVAIAEAAGLEVFQAGCSEDEDADFFIGIGVSTGSNRGGDYEALLSDIDLGAVRDKLKKFLEPHSLWDEKDFGLWALLYVSI